MDWFLFQPLFVLSLTQVLLLFILSIYLVSIKNKTKGTWLLAAALTSIGVLWIQQLLVHSLIVHLPFAIDPIDELAVPITLWALLGFAYAFLSDPFRKEARLVLSLTGVMVGGNALYQLYRVIAFQPFPQVGGLVIELANLIMILGALSVYIRKRAKISKSSDQESQKKRNRRALLSFSLLTVGMLLLSLRGIWVAALPIWPALGTPSALLSMINLPIFVVLLVSLVVVYVNHMPEPTSIQAKIIGLSLVTMLAVLGLLDPILFSQQALQKEGLSLLPNQKTLRFEPDTKGGYLVAYVPFKYDSDLGENLLLGPETEALVKLDFEFPFYDEKWEEMYVDSNGLISFRGPYLSRRFDDFYLNELPKIAPFYRSLVPVVAKESGVFYKQEEGKATVTWLLVWESLSGVPSNRNTVQLVLYKNGVIDFVYDRVEAPYNGYADGLRGIRPGGSAIPRENVNLTALPVELVTSGNLLGNQAVRFESDAMGNYTAVQIPFHFDREPGENLNLGDDTNALVSLDFEFPFFGSSWKEVHVNANGVVAFGAPVNPVDSIFYRPLQDFFNQQPKIAPLFVDLNPAQGGGVFYKNETDRTSITWNNVPLLNTPFTSNVQLVLHENGAVDFVYDWVGIPLFGPEYWGLYSNETGERYDASDYLYALNAVSLSPASAVLEDFSLLYRRYTHDKIAPLAFVVLLCTLFILGVFPFFFRVSIVKPLNALLIGVRQVDEGDLDTSVPVRVNDEIGLLAQNFNRMTSSLKLAEEQLRVYAEGLEDKVAERTADLEMALKHLTETQDRLIHAEKMASLGALTSGIAHEIKNPLNFVNNFSELSTELVEELMEELHNPERSQEEALKAIENILPDLKHNAQKIQEHGKRADGIVKSMLQHSSNTMGSRQVVNVNSIVKQYVMLAQQQIESREESGVTVKEEFHESAGEVEMAPKEIGRVIINLVNNALYAVMEKSKAKDDAYKPLVKISTRRLGPSVEIKISDNGQGIARKNRGHIFEPFFTTKPTGTGTGLGLSLSHDIITRGHSGDLEVESTEGEGSTFTIRLPDNLSQEINDV